MATPNPEVLFVFDGATGVPYTGSAGGLAFVVYDDDTGSPVTPPAITKITNGIFQFTPVFSGHGIYYVISTGQAPAYLCRYMRPEEANLDSISTLLSTITQMQEFEQGKWTIATTGGDANRLIIYASDGVTVLAKFNLFDSSGNPTSANPYSRVPV